MKLAFSIPALLLWSNSIFKVSIGKTLVFDVLLAPILCVNVVVSVCDALWHFSFTFYIKLFMTGINENKTTCFKYLSEEVKTDEAGICKNINGIAKDKILITSIACLY